MPFTNVLFKDNFSSTSTGWDQVHETDYTLEYKNGSYHVVVNQQNGGQSVWNGKDYTNMSVEVDATLNAGPDDALVGVSCRYSQDNGGYSFEISRNGYYGIYMYDSRAARTGLDERYAEPEHGQPHRPQPYRGHLQRVDFDDGTERCGTDAGGRYHHTPPAAAGLIVRTGDSGAAGIDVSFNQFVVKGP